MERRGHHCLHHAGMERFGAGGNLLSSSDDDDESTRGEPRIVSESIDVAIETCATRLAKLPEIRSVSRGISFGIDFEPSGPDTSWNMILHRGPLPLLEIELSNAPRFHPPDGWRDALIDSHCAHVVRFGKGSGDNVVLALKRTKLFPYSKGSSNVKPWVPVDSSESFAGRLGRNKPETATLFTNYPPGNGDANASSENSIKVLSITQAQKI